MKGLRRRSGHEVTLSMARRAGQHCLEKRAEDVQVLDLRGLTSATDFFVIATGQSDTQIRGIANHVQEQLGAQDWHPWHVEGMAPAQWVLLDYVDFVVHIFHPEARAFYQLERLWGDARTDQVEE